MLWESDSGQYVLALDIDEEKGGLHVISRPASSAEAANIAEATQAAYSADEFYAKAFALEESDPGAARAAYEACLAADPKHLEAQDQFGEAAASRRPLQGSGTRVSRRPIARSRC